ncbi:DUF1659 domain-containing protein [Mahella australiensis]|uniref:DUF1659 domain-containing protein n=1 Tax=Mahella australiensis (strain DSM 15567 / CIP 107919 / 50-1 BON) TaxID=697281 RepID=F3ZY26_MAHA5|nr:DUF1659 domain-containing protein [Mahella australiensis]AEE97722.1 protein of unknown function DUF1659 [Mahella australiensis 50-1 BON]
MAVEVRPTVTRLRINMDYGTDANGRKLTRSKSFNNVKPDAADQTIFDVAIALADLQEHPVTAIRKVSESDLVEA